MKITGLVVGTAVMVFTASVLVGKGPIGWLGVTFIVWAWPEVAIAFVEGWDA